MMTYRLLPVFLLLIIHTAVQAQLYKWTGPDGKINYSDIPPPASINHIEKKDLAAPGNNIVLPYELAQAVKTMPVIMYSGVHCPQCNEGRNFLIKNGIPFSEKIVTSNAEIDKLIKLTGSGQIPVLFIGKNKLVGLNSSEWRLTLTQAGYPTSNVLPANYSFSAAQPLLPPVSVQTESPINAQPKSSEPSMPQTRDPNAFHF